MTIRVPTVRNLKANLHDDRAILGGKACGIQRMMALGIPVPPAFTVTTQACSDYRKAGGRLSDDVRQELPDAMAALEKITGRTFGSGDVPLLVSVRSGAAVSMPGMMDTILNLGMTDKVQESLALHTGDVAFAADARRRFEAQYAAIVGTGAPPDPWNQLLGAIGAVFASWDSRRALAYRHSRGLDNEAGTAVTVQAMVFGNLDDKSGTGVLFSRDPRTGAREPFGEWLACRQGEDLVSGTHDPRPLSDLAITMPHVYAELMRYAALLELQDRDVQDIEFTVEAGRLWLLQTRAAKRSPDAAVRLAVSFVEEGLLSPSEALDLVAPDQVAAVLRAHIEPRAQAEAKVLARGRPACPGALSGTIVTDTERAQSLAEAGQDVILARPTTDPEDVPAMSVVAAVVTEFGGSTSHAAVVAREMGVPCIVGCGEGTLMCLDGQTVTLDAALGEIYQGTLSIVEPRDPTSASDLAKLLRWARAEEGADPAASLPQLLIGRRSETRAAGRILFH